MAEQAAWDGVLDDYEAGRLSSRNSHTVLNRTPVVLARILSDDGKNPNLKIVIDRSILDKTTGKTPSKFTGEYHHISVKDLRGLLVNLDNPIAVFDSETIPGDKVVLTEIKDFETGENAVVALAIGTKRGYIAVNAVSSIHGRRASSLNKWLKDGKLRYCNTQKFPAAVGVRWGGYPQRAVPGGKSPQRSVSVGVQNPQAAAPSGNASLLTEDDFKDELGVVKVNEENRFSLSMMDDEAAEKVARERRRDGARKKSAKTAARTGSRWRQGQGRRCRFFFVKIPYSKLDIMHIVRYKKFAEAAASRRNAFPRLSPRRRFRISGGRVRRVPAANGFTRSVAVPAGTAADKKRDDG